MYKKCLPVLMLAESPLHVGSGSELGLVDLPIQRERHTGVPKIEASGIKGCMREAFEGLGDERAVSLVFGPEQGGDHAGCLAFTDARLLLFPVKSMKGIFAWTTCPQVLEKFCREMLRCGISVPAVPEAYTVPAKSGVTIGSEPLKVVLEEYACEVTADGGCTSLAEWLAGRLFPPVDGSEDVYRIWREKLARDLVVLSDTDFRDFANLSTEVVARTRIDNNTGTVAKGALFYEEYLPQESVMYVLAMASPFFAKKEDRVLKHEAGKEEEAVMSFFLEGMPPVIQIGGDATIGKGLVKLTALEV